MVWVMVHERGLVFYYRDRLYTQDFPSAWMGLLGVEARDAVRSAIRKASARLGFPLKGPYRVLTFNEFFHYFSEIKQHMRPSPAEIAQLAWSKFSSFYELPEGAEVVVSYTYGVDGLYATAFSKGALESLLALFPGPAMAYSGTLYFVKYLQEKYASQPRALGFFVEMGTGLGVSLVQGEVYAIARLPALEKVNPMSTLSGDLLAEYARQIEEEVEALLPGGLGSNLAVGVGGAWGEAVMQQLGLGMPYEALPAPSLWGVSESYNEVFYLRHRGSEGVNLKRYLPWLALGLIALGDGLYWAHLRQQERALERAIEENRKVLQEAKRLEKQVERMEVEVSQYQQATSAIQTAHGPYDLLLPILRALAVLGKDFGVSELRLLESGGASLSLQVSQKVYKSPLNVPDLIRQAFLAQGYPRVEIVEYRVDKGEDRMRFRILLPLPVPKVAPQENRGGPQSGGKNAG